jgi:hypothetical protein
MTQPKYMSCSTVQLFHSLVHTNTKQKIWIPCQATKWSSFETGTGPWSTPTGYLQTAILKPEPKRNFQLFPSAVKHRVTVHGNSPTEQPPWGIVRGATLTSTKVPLSTAQSYIIITIQTKALNISTDTYSRTNLYGEPSNSFKVVLSPTRTSPARGENVSR